MRYARTLLTTLLLFILASALWALESYRTNQSALQLESNSLHSTHQVYTNATVNSVLKTADAKVPDAYVSSYLEPTGHLRAVWGHHLDTLPWPLRSGRTPDRGESNIALVGKDAPVSHMNGRTVISIDSQRYPVVGTLGHAGRTSLLDDHVVIISAELTENAPGGLRVDSLKSSALQTVLGGVTSAVQDSGSLRRTDSDFVSPIIRAITLITVPLGSIAAGLLMAGWLRPIFSTRFILGTSRRALLRGAASLSLVLPTCAWLLSWLSFSPTTPYQVSTANVALQCAATILLPFVAAFLTTSWSATVASTRHASKASSHAA